MISHVNKSIGLTDDLVDNLWINGYVTIIMPPLIKIPTQTH